MREISRTARAPFFDTLTADFSALSRNGRVGLAEAMDGGKTLFRGFRYRVFKLSNRRTMRNSEPKRYLLEAISSFERATGSAVATSESRIGIVHTGRQNRVLMSYAKAITHAMSIHLLTNNSVSQTPDFGLLDHFSIGALTRTLIDASIMTLYLSEPSLCEAEWDLRRHVLYLHDSTNRKRFLEAMHRHAGSIPSTGDLDTHRQSKDCTIRVIVQRGKELGLDEGKIENLSKGQLVYIDGVRGAVREAGLDLTVFEFLQVYLGLS